MKRIASIVMVAMVLLLAVGCSSSAVDVSKARSRNEIESGKIVTADELRVAEYVNYYKQSFPEPTNATLGLDLRLGNTQMPTDGGSAWLQIGVQARSAQTDVIAPLNLAIVIDRSGSMADPEKMPYLKQSLRVFLHSLAANDIVALVAFNQSGEVIQSSTKVGDGNWIDRAVERLEPNGNTNMNEGLLLGFKEVNSNFDLRRNNRVILLTDGLTNTGETNADRIAEVAKNYNDKGIYLSTIGLGKDFNDPLLIKLANQGKGAYHFVDSAAEMENIFGQESSGLLQKAASDVSVTIRPQVGVSVESVTGFEGKPPAGAFQVKLRDMGTGDSQVVLARLNVAAGQSGSRQLATVELHYQDLFGQREGSATQSVVVDARRMNNYDATWDVEVLRNVTIQSTAEGLKEIDRLYKARRYQDAWQIANGLERDLREVARLSNDSQMVQDADMMRKYQDTLAKWVQNETGKSPQASDSGTSLNRGRLPVDGAAPTIEIK